MNFKSPSTEPLRTLLIADDQSSVLTTLEYVLSGAYRVLRAENGAQALALASEQLVDGALIDLHMLGLSGLETCRRLRALGADNGRRWPVWLMSAAATNEARRLALEAGACGLIPKPFPFDLLSQLASAWASPASCATPSS